MTDIYCIINFWVGGGWCGRVLDNQPPLLPPLACFLAGLSEYLVFFNKIFMMFWQQYNPTLNKVFNIFASFNIQVTSHGTLQVISVSNTYRHISPTPQYE